MSYKLEWVDSVGIHQIWSDDKNGLVTLAIALTHTGGTLGKPHVWDMRDDPPTQAY